MTHFSGTRGNINGRVLIVAESYGAEEAKQGRPLVGRSGHDLSDLLKEIGIDEGDCFFTNVLNRQPQGNDMKQFFYSTKEAKAERAPEVKGLYPRPIIMVGLQELENVIASMPHLQLIVGFGNYTLWALTESDFRISNDQGYKVPTGIGDYRGSQLRSTHGHPLIPCYHPAAALRQYSWRYLIKHDLGTRARKAFLNDWDDFERSFRIRPSFGYTTKILDFLYGLLENNSHCFAFDIETRHHMIACLGIAWTKWDAICIPFMTATGDKEGYWSEEEEFIIVEKLRRILNHPNLLLCGQNFLYDAQYLALYWGIIPKITHDTMIMQHLCYPGTPLSLNHISSLYNHYHRYWKDEGKQWDPSMDEEQLWSYNCRDCVATLEAAHELLKMIRHFELEEQYWWQQRQLQSITRMIARGVRVDKKAQLELMQEMLELESEHTSKLDRLLPEDVYPRPKKVRPWHGSNKQQCTIFYEALGCRPKYNKRKDGGRTLTVDDEALDKLKREEPLLAQMIELLQQYRSLSVFGSFARMSTGQDGRARCSFTPTAETFRWKSSEDAFGSGRNLQNLPKGQEE